MYRKCVLSNSCDDNGNDDNESDDNKQQQHAMSMVVEQPNIDKS